MLEKTMLTMHVLGMIILVSSSAPGARDRLRLPPAAANVIKANFPGATITGIGRERERGAWYYEVNLRQDGRRFEVEVTKEGVIGEIEARIELNDVPAPLLKAIRERIGRGKIARVEKHERRGIARSGKFVPLATPRIMYEVKYYTGSGRRREIQVASNEILELPDEVVSRVKTVFPSAEIKEVEAEDDEGIMVFVVQMTQNGGSFDVVALRDGRILEMETLTSFQQAPRAVYRELVGNKRVRKSDSVMIRKRETFAAVEDGKIVKRHDITYAVSICRGDEMRECRFDGRGKLLTTSDWGPFADDEDDDD